MLDPYSRGIVLRYRIVPARSRVWIDARSNVHPIHTEATGLDGWIEFEWDADQRSHSGWRGHVEFPVTKLKSGNPFENRELLRRIDACAHDDEPAELSFAE